MTVTSASWSVDAGPSPVSPHPVTVATWPVYRDWVEAGRQMGATVVEKVRGNVKNNMEKSKSAFSLLYLGWILIIETSRLSTTESAVLCSPTRTYIV